MLIRTQRHTAGTSPAASLAAHADMSGHADAVGVTA
jgi:hypothetical protein